jgi:hypothetical protein
MAEKKGRSKSKVFDKESSLAEAFSADPYCVLSMPSSVCTSTGKISFWKGPEFIGNPSLLHFFRTCEKEELC